MTASLDGRVAAAELTATLVGDGFLDGTDAGARDAFAGPESTADPLSLEYPVDGVIVPANLAPLEVQWSAPIAASLFRTRVTSADFVDLTLYTRRPELAIPADVWSRMAASAPD